MTRQDFKAIAQAIANGFDRVSIAQGIADYAETRNPRFDRVRFLEACGLKVEAVETYPLEILNHWEAIRGEMENGSTASEAIVKLGLE